MVVPPPLIVPPPLAMPPPFFIPPPLQLPTVSHTRSLIPTPITKPTTLKSPANTPASTTDTKPGSIEAIGLQNTPSSEDDPPMLAPLPIQELNQTSSPNSLGQTSLVLCSSAETIANIMLHFDSALFCAVPAENLTTAAAVTSALTTSRTRAKDSKMGARHYFTGD
ncbi:hypothetical protein Pelo_19637 [Pelomyxa schiedti]|nr:hypothetical protein Pelo_19637 [Pelomyxa schiedti]